MDTQIFSVNSHNSYKYYIKKIIGDFSLFSVQAEEYKDKIMSKFVLYDSFIRCTDEVLLCRGNMSCMLNIKRKLLVFNLIV